MATTIDQKVVEMKFDNRDFERNTKQSMSTLEKLKKKLNFSGASKGLEEFGKAAKKVDMSGLATGIATVQAKFSAMEVVGVTALANITNSAVNAGKRMINALTVAPVSDGFNEYEMVLGAIQTTMAGTGKTAKEVQEQLKLLDIYADKTVYSTSDMLNNLPKFTNAGVELETATTAMIGIANATALAGGDANKASIAFYNLGQAIGTGYLSRMDYNSINNAGIATMEWKQQMVDAAIAAGTLVQVGDDLYRAGNRTMTLQQLFIEGLQEQWATTEVMLKVFGDYGDETTAIGKKAYAAAQNIKTFSMMMDSLKATAGTGWKDTWQIIFGDLDQATEMWTGLTNFIGQIINSMDNLRNEFLGNAFNFDGFQRVMDKISNNSVVQTMSNINDKVKETSRTLEEYQDIVNKVWRGDYNNRGDNPDRYDLLAQDGWNPQVVQELVNLGYKYELSIEDCKRAEEKFGISVEEITASQEKQLEVAKELNRERLEELGLSDEEIKMYEQLAMASMKYGISIDDLLAKMKKSTGRDLLFGKKKRNEDGTIAVDEYGYEMYETVGVAQNIAAALTNIFGSIKRAWSETFIGMSSIDLYMIFENINRFSASIRKATENERGMRNLTDTFKGLFAVLKLITTLVGGGVKIAWTVFKTVLQTCGVTVLDFTGAVGNMVSSLVNFITENEIVINGIVWLTKLIAHLIVSTYQWTSSFISLNDAIHIFQNGLKKAKEDFFEWAKGLKETDNIPKYIIDGLVNGIKKYGGKALNGITSFFGTLITVVKEKLGIHSPSKVFFYIGVDIVKGLYNGIASLIGVVYNLVKTIGVKLADIIKNMDFGALLITTISATVLTFILSKIAKIVKIFGDGIQSINGVIDGAGTVLKSFSGVLKAVKVKVMASSLKTLATAIVMLVASVVVLTLIDQDKMWNAIDAIGALVIALSILISVAALSSKIAGADLEFGKLALTILAIGIAMGMMSKALKRVSEIDSTSWGTIIAFGSMIFALIKIISLLSKGGFNATEASKAILGIGVTFYLMSAAIKKLANLEPEQIAQGIIALNSFCFMIAALFAATRLLGGKTKSIETVGKTLISVGVTFYLMAMTVKKLGKLKPGEVIQGTAVLTAFCGMIVGLIASTNLLGKNSKNIQSIGKTLMSIGVAILLMGVTAKLLGNMDSAKLIKGMAAVGAFEGMVIGLIAAMKKIGGTDCKNIGVTLMGIAVAIGIMSVSCVLMSFLDIESLAKGITAVGLLSKFMEGLIKSTSGNHIISSKPLWAMVAAIGVMSLCVAGLSLIDPAKLVTPISGMGLLMGMFSLLIKSSKQLDGADGKKLAINLGIMLLAIGALTAVVFALSKINGTNAVTSASALGIVIAALVGALYGLDKINKVNYKKLAGQLMAMVGLLGVMYLASQVLKELSGADNLIGPAIALSLLIGAMSLIVLAIGNMKINPKDLIIGLAGLIALCAMLVPLIAVIGLLSLSDNAPKTILALTGFIGMLSIMLLAIAASGAIYAATGGVALLGLVGLAALLPIMVGLVAIIAVMSSIKNAEKNCSLLTRLMDAMALMLVKIALVGPLALIGVGALNALMVMMPIMIAFATILGALVTYIPALQTFLDTGLTVMTKVASAMGEMVGAFVGGALSQVSTALPIIGSNLSLFMKNSQGFVTRMKKVNGKVLEGAGILTGAIIALSVAKFINGITSLMPLGSRLSNLGTELTKFAINALPFLIIMSVVPSSAMSGVEALANSVLALTAANVLDGLTRFFSKGKSSLSEFGAQLPPLGTAMSKFVINLGVFGDDQIKTTDCAGKAIVSLAESAKKLPKTGGLWQKIFGEQQGLAEFATDMPIVGENIAGFVTKLGTFGDKQIETAKAACEVIVAMADAADSIPAEDGLWQKIFGSKGEGLTKFAENMPKVGEGVKGFIGQLSDVADKADVANAAGGIISGIAQLSDINFDKANEKLPGFGDTMTNFGDKLKNFIEKMKAFSSEDVKTANNNLELITTAAQNMMETINTEISDNSGDIASNMTEVVKKASEAITSDDNMNNVKAKARDFVQGFANGIQTKENLKLVRNAGIRLGEEATAGVAEGTDSHSPSREAMKQGDYFGKGFIIGIKEYSSRVYNISKEIGEQARLGLSSAVARVSSLIDSDINSSPTIRPVLDLSDVINGAGRIKSMFNNPNLQVMSNLNAISAGVNARIQNGSNNDVISAINKLGKNLGGSTGNTYNINGITYEGDSAINDAVLGLIKAIEIERRV